MNIWNGTTSSRATLDNTKSPDHIDYLQIVSEIQQLQNFVTSLSQNITIMPNLEEELQKAYVLVEHLRSDIRLITPPDDLIQAVGQLSVQLAAIDSRKDILRLQQDIESLRNLIATSQLQVLKLQGAFETDVKGFQNKVWNTLSVLQKEVRDRLEVFEGRVTSLTTHVDIAKLLGQLRQ